jgi:hypothetical protein
MYLPHFCFLFYYSTEKRSLKVFDFSWTFVNHFYSFITLKISVIRINKPFVKEYFLKSPLSDPPYSFTMLSYNTFQYLENLVL